MPSFSTPLRAQSHDLMGMALDHANTTPSSDVPVAALIFDPEGRVIGRGVNRREADQNPLAHAEMLAIQEALGHTGDGWRLSDCTMAVTLEPCTMCAGALVGARLGRLIFGAFEPKTGACGSVFDVIRDPMVMHRMEVLGGVREAECAELLESFFQRLRS
ncbi:nucleoside deaminase [Corynebacterium pseudopelargi]|uniref:tRNA-specific adenosine deaminase n=1 Tax=Corynebacterium pseudopelargi TaxID=2080757 RepID=A0A3G6J1J2_9CORY|nr:nucleoside deaminase [Corynebacterium pseudopelargi]AZA10240.1 tRNA-specific adenosine deaminase [Corynebacterium pseudopelargi]